MHLFGAHFVGLPQVVCEDHGRRGGAETPGELIRMTSAVAIWYSCSFYHVFELRSFLDVRCVQLLSSCQRTICKDYASGAKAP